MMQQEIVFAGFGGQGVLSMGAMLAYAAMKEGREVSWFPSYGPEMRGGTANCMVNISDTAISSPVVTSYDLAVVMNLPSLNKFESKVKPGGILIWESSTIKQPPKRTDIRSFPLPAIHIAADELGNVKVMNMIMMGALLALNKVVKKESVLTALKDNLPKRYHNLLPLNKNALEKGMKLIEDLL